MIDTSQPSKHCSRCEKVKPLVEFHVQARAKDGRQHRCKACGCALARAWHAANKERRAEQRRGYFQKNKDRLRENNDRWAAEHPEAMLDYCRAYRGRNPGKDAAKARRYRQANPEKIRIAQKAYHSERPGLKNQWDAERRAREKQAMPTWADRDAIATLYKEARRLTRETGVEHHVDHVIPLQHPRVCGLHVETNLQLLSAVENLKKSNRLVVE